MYFSSGIDNDSLSGDGTNWNGGKTDVIFVDGEITVSTAIRLLLDDGDRSKIMYR